MNVRRFSPAAAAILTACAIGSAASGLPTLRPIAAACGFLAMAAVVHSMTVLRGLSGERRHGPAFILGAAWFTAAPALLDRRPLPLAITVVQTAFLAIGVLSSWDLIRAGLPKTAVARFCRLYGGPPPLRVERRRYVCDFNADLAASSLENGLVPSSPFDVFSTPALHGARTERRFILYVRQNGTSSAHLEMHPDGEHAILTVEVGRTFGSAGFVWYAVAFSALLFLGGLYALVFRTGRDAAAAPVLFVFAALFSTAVLVISARDQRTLLRILDAELAQRLDARRIE